MSLKAITFEADTLDDYSKARSKEWLVTNQLGGYASSTITGANTRGYHGLLVASLGPSMRRTLLLSKLEESVTINDVYYQLSVNKYPRVIHPEGHRYLKEFRLDPNPHFIYEVGGVTVTKTVYMPSKYNCTITTYEADTPRSIQFLVKPLVTNRGFHSRLREDSGVAFTQHPGAKGLSLESNKSPTKLFMLSNFGVYEPSETWYKNLVYDEETERGLDDREDLFSPGYFKANLERGKKYRIVASADAPTPEFEAPPSIQNTDNFSLHDWLTHAAGQFIVNLPDGGCTIIAGYHWFGEWGRDAAISLPGLLLTSKRYEEAKKVLRRFLSQTQDGLTPNLITEEGEQTYTSIDASLWMIYAAYKYYTYTGDQQFLKEIYPKLSNIITCYQRGNACVKTSDDGLLESTQRESSFTWMDARVDGAPVTPRVGKCVEVNALYYNALRSLEVFARSLGHPSELYAALASDVKKTFDYTFWYTRGGYLYDCVGEDGPDASIRPNQILSLSLPFTVLERAKGGSLLEVVEHNLLTPYGLRTLSPSDPRYRGTCTGTPSSRDSSYHNGTVWPWLTGSYITARTRLGLSLDTYLVGHILNHFKQHLYDAGLGSVSEIFDGDPPHRPRGCIAQAWSVGELLRIYAEDLKESKLKTL